MLISSSLGESVFTIRVIIGTWEHLVVGGGKGAHEKSKIGLKSLLLWKITLGWASSLFFSNHPTQLPMGTWMLLCCTKVFQWLGMELVIASTGPSSLWSRFNFLETSLSSSTLLFSIFHKFIIWLSPFLSNYAVLFLENPNPIPWISMFHYMCMLKTWCLSWCGRIDTCSKIKARSYPACILIDFRHIWTRILHLYSTLWLPFSFTPQGWKFAFRN